MGPDYRGPGIFAGTRRRRTRDARLGGSTMDIFPARDQAARLSIYRNRGDVAGVADRLSLLVQIFMVAVWNFARAASVRAGCRGDNRRIAEMVRDRTDKDTAQ